MLTACACGRCARWSPACAPRASRPKNPRKAPRTTPRRSKRFRESLKSPDLTGPVDVVFHAVEGARDYPDGADRVPLRGPELLSRSAGQDLARLGAAPTRARPRSSRRLLSAARGRRQLCEEGAARSGPRRRSPDAARCQDRVHRRRHRAQRRGRGSDHQGIRPAGRARQAARAGPAAGRTGRIQRSARPRGDGCWRRPDPARHPAGRDDRAHAQDHRAVDPDRRTSRQRARDRRARHPAPGQRSHPGAGPRPPGPDPPEGIAGQDCKDGIPHGRSFGAAGPSAAGRVAAGLRVPAERHAAAARLRGQEAGAGCGRRPNRRPGDLRPAHQ
ncbi:hypothetical protein ACVW1A_007012 [Bradyrhizobium sp. LB1.3]